MAILNPNLKIVYFSGILDGTRLEEVRQTIEALNIQAQDQILIDLAEVEFMDSSGLSSLIIALKYVRSLNADLSVCAPTAQVKMLLELTSMDQLFSIFPDRVAHPQTAVV